MRSSSVPAGGGWIIKPVVSFLWHVVIRYLRDVVHWQAIVDISHHGGLFTVGVQVDHPGNHVWSEGHDECLRSMEAHVSEWGLSTTDIIINNTTTTNYYYQCCCYCCSYYYCHTHVSNNGHNRHHVEDLLPGANASGFRCHWPFELGGELPGVHPDFQNVVEQSQEGGQGEWGHKQSDEAKLDH